MYEKIQETPIIRSNLLPKISFTIKEIIIEPITEAIIPLIMGHYGHNEDNGSNQGNYLHYHSYTLRKGDNK